MLQQVTCCPPCEISKVSMSSDDTLVRPSCTHVQHNVLAVAVLQLGCTPVTPVCMLIAALRHITPACVGVNNPGVYLCYTDDPATDYWAVREELRMYNPEYCARPHIVALNKMDLQDAAHLRAEIAAEVVTMAHRIQVGHAPGHVHSLCNACGSM